MLSERTKAFTSNVEGFKGMRARLYQRLCRQDIFLVVPRQNELPEMDTARDGQQSTCDGHHSSPVTEFKGPNHRWG